MRVVLLWLGLLIASPAQAATLFYNPVIDLDAYSSYSPDNGEYVYFLGLNPPTFALNPGDTLAGTITFAGGRSATILDTGPANQGLERLQLLLFGDIGPVFWTSSFSFGNVTGDYVGPSSVLSGIQGLQDYFGTQFGPRTTSNLTNSSFTFDQINYQATLTSGSAVSFKPALFFIGAMAAPAPTPVPEPATWVMMLVGFGIAGAAMRRRSGSAAHRLQSILRTMRAIAFR